ncbi:MAG: helix-turn-helix domain-containing protein [Cuniculiplasma sp.]
MEEKIAGEIVLSHTPNETLKKWREEFLITKSELAREMNVSLSMISDYESGRRQSPGVSTIKKFVSAMVRIETNHGGRILRRYKSGVPYDALIDLRDYDRDINLKTIINKIKGTSVSRADTDRYVRGYTIVNGVKAILSFSYSEYSLLYGWSSQRVIFFTDVKMGRSPMIAIRVHPLKPAAVVYVKADRVDELAIRLSEIENIPLITTEMSTDEISMLISNIR